MKQIYLDYAASTPVDSDVFKIYTNTLKKTFANPSSLHKSGVEASKIVTEARKKVASVLSCRSSEVVFTAGGTESLNLAILGTAFAYFAKHKKPGNLVISKLEHESVLRACDFLKTLGWKVYELPNDTKGFVNLKAVSELVNSDTVLVSIILGNNEIGTIQDIKKIAKQIKQNNPQTYLHTDASAVAGILDVRPLKLGVDLLSLNGSKIYGLKQTGCLYVARGVEVSPIIHGGGQEEGLRSGTENPAGFISFALALEKAESGRLKEVKRLNQLSSYFFEKVRKFIPEARLNGPDLNSSENFIHRIPGNVSLQIPNVEGELLLLYMDASGVEISTGSACSLASMEVSKTLQSIGLSLAEARSTVRVTMGRQTTRQDLKTAAECLFKSYSLIKNTTQEL